MNNCLCIALLLSLMLPLAAAGKEDPVEPDQKFIVGGEDTSIENYPAMVALLDRPTFDSFSYFEDKFSSQFCGGTLIASNWVLTSAHCVTRFDPDGFPTQIPVDAREILAVLNVTDLDSNQGDFSEIERIVVHPDFDGRSSSRKVVADIALLKLKTDFPEQPTMPYLGGTQAASASAGVGAGTSARIIGWGALSDTDPIFYPSVLQQADTTVISNQDCADAYAPEQTDIDETHLCAQAPGVDVCYADSGGPLLVEAAGTAGGPANFVQAGISSFGIGCASAEFPGVYTRVSEYADWIQATLEELALFATFGNGQSGPLVLTSDIVLYNPHALRTARGQILFKDAGGPLLDATTILVGGEPEFVIPPLGSMTFSTTGSGDIVSGSVWVASDEKVSGVIRFSLSGVGIAGVSPSRPGTRLIAPVRRVGTVNTGIAVLNADAARVRVILELKAESGEVLDVAIRDLDPMERIALFVDQLFPGTDTNGFRGTVCLEADGQIGVIAIEQGSGSGEFTTLQVTTVE